MFFILVQEAFTHFKLMVWGFHEKTNLEDHYGLGIIDHIEEWYQVYITRITSDSDHVNRITNIVIMDEFMQIIA